MSPIARASTTLAATAVATLALAPPALADSGTITITEAKPLSDKMMQLSVRTTVTKDVCDAANCNWFPVVFKVPAGQPCVADEHSIFSLPRDSTSPRGIGTFTDDYPPGFVTDPVRLCLYLNNQGPEQHKLLGQLDYQPPADTPAPAPAPAASPRLDMARAKRAVKPILRQKYGSRFASRRGFKRSCRRATASQVRCAVRWIHKGTRYKGTLRIATNPDDASNLRFATDIQKRRVR